MKASALALPLLLAALGLLAGCGTPSQSLHMSVKPGAALQLRGFMPERLRGQVSLADVIGGAETGRWWGSKVSSLSLEQALEDSLRAVDLWASNPSNARYRLKVQLLGLSQPQLSLDTEVTSAVHFSLVERAGETVIYQRTVRTAHKAQFSEALLSNPERLRLANEGAIRQAIELMLRDLASLRLGIP